MDSDPDPRVIPGYGFESHMSPVVDQTKIDPVVDCTRQDYKTMHKTHYQLVEESWISLNQTYFEVLSDVHG